MEKEKVESPHLWTLHYGEGRCSIRRAFLCELAVHLIELRLCCVEFCGLGGNPFGELRCPLGEFGALAGEAAVSALRFCRGHLLVIVGEIFVGSADGFGEIIGMLDDSGFDEGLASR